MRLIVGLDCDDTNLTDSLAEKKESQLAMTASWLVISCFAIAVASSATWRRTSTRTYRVAPAEQLELSHYRRSHPTLHVKYFTCADRRGSMIASFDSSIESQGRLGTVCPGPAIGGTVD